MIIKTNFYRLRQRNVYREIRRMREVYKYNLLFRTILNLVYPKKCLLGNSKPKKLTLKMQLCQLGRDLQNYNKKHNMTTNKAIKQLKDSFSGLQNFGVKK